MGPGRLVCLRGADMRHWLRRYLLDLRVEARQRAAVQRMVEGLAPGASLTEKGGGHLSFALPAAGLDLPALFAKALRSPALTAIPRKLQPSSANPSFLLHLLSGLQVN